MDELKKSEEDESLRRKLRELPRVGASPGFEQRLHARLHEDRGRKSETRSLSGFRSFFRLPAVAYSALGILLVGTVSIYLLSRRMPPSVPGSRPIPSAVTDSVTRVDAAAKEESDTSTSHDRRSTVSPSGETKTSGTERGILQKTDQNAPARDYLNENAMRKGKEQKDERTMDTKALPAAEGTPSVLKQKALPRIMEYERSEAPPVPDAALKAAAAPDTSRKDSAAHRDSMRTKVLKTGKKKRPM